MNRAIACVRPRNIDRERLPRCASGAAEARPKDCNVLRVGEALHQSGDQSGPGFQGREQQMLFMSMEAVPASTQAVQRWDAEGSRKVAVATPADTGTAQ